MPKSWLKSWMMPVAAAFALVLLVGSIDFANAAPRDGGRSYSGGVRSSPMARSFSGARVYSGNRSARVYSYAGKPHYAYRHHRRGFVGVPYGVYGYGYGYGYYGDNSCYWLRRRAENTGSSYWWNRYYACVGDYD